MTALLESIGHVCTYYRIRGLFGGDFNLAVLANFYWFAKVKSRHFNSHTRNDLIYHPFRQIKMTPTLFLNKSPNILLANKSTYTVYNLLPSSSKIKSLKCVIKKIFKNFHAHINYSGNVW